MDRDRILSVTRAIEFSAAHRLYREELSERENRELFGACANPYGHGHNYRLEVTVRGALDSRTGMVVHFARLKTVLKELVEVPLDHRHLNHDVEMLRGILPTSENLVCTLWEVLYEAFAGQPFRLEKLVLYSNDRSRVEYGGPSYED
jgi:6-pyruvoyltetrahydropterin/6-carboxytetrahydropterin synthase